MKAAQAASPFALKPWLLRLLLMAPTVAAIVLVWHATTRLDRVQREMAELETQNGRLSRDIENVERDWMTGDIEAVKTRHDEVTARMRGGAELISLWLQQANERASQLALEIVPRFEAPMVRTIGSTTVTLVPATLDVRPAPGLDGGGRSAYQRLLDLCLHLSTQTNRADLMQLSVQTGSNSVSRATVSFSLWTKEALQ